MFPVPARVSRAASNVAWSLSTHFNAILPEGELPKPLLGARPAAQEPRKNAHDDRRSEENPVTVPGVQH